jgi:hypothetical protein
MRYHLKIFTVILVLTAVLAVPAGCGDTEQVEGALEKAAIIDQLYLLEPNSSFIGEAAGLLESYGFAVDLWQGSEITVDFYRKLPSMGYKLIIFRVHSGLLMNTQGGAAKAMETTYLFTAENYTTVRYITDQLTDKVSNALMSDKIPLVFAVNSAFIKGAEGRFQDTVVIMMGCESYYYEDMPKVFIEKGASAYIGWSTVVSLDYVDNAVLDLLGNLFAANMPLAKGINQTMSDLGRDPNFNAYLKYYPPASGNHTVKELINNEIK